jgi:hypothetical protein
MTASSWIRCQHRFSIQSYPKKKKVLADDHIMGQFQIKQLSENESDRKATTAGTCVIIQSCLFREFSLFGLASESTWLKAIREDRVNRERLRASSLISSDHPKILSNHGSSKN